MGGKGTNERVPESVTIAYQWDAFDYGTRVAITIAAAAVLFLGIMPGGMLDFAKHASQLLAR